MLAIAPFLPGFGQRVEFVNTTLLPVAALDEAVVTRAYRAMLAPAAGAWRDSLPLIVVIAPFAAALHSSTDPFFKKQALRYPTQLAVMLSYDPRQGIACTAVRLRLPASTRASKEDAWMLRDGHLSSTFNDLLEQHGSNPYQLTRATLGFFDYLQRRLPAKLTGAR